MLVLRRAGPLLATIVPAAGLIAIGLVLWVIPGLVVAFCFALVAQVAVIEGLKGAPALRRSVELVGADWLRIALLLAVFGALTWAARLLADLVVPDSAVFMTQLVGDLLDARRDAAAADRGRPPLLRSAPTSRRIRRRRRAGGARLPAPLAAPARRRERGYPRKR